MKRLAVIVSVLILCTLLTVGALVLALRSARVQTAAVSLLAEEIGRSLGVEAHIGRVDIDPPLALRLSDVYLGDRNNDTLLSVPSLRVRFNPFALEDNRLSFPLAEIEQPYIRIVQDSTATNLDFLLKAFASPNPKPLPYAVEFRKIALSDARVRYIRPDKGTDVILSNIQTDLGFRYAGKDSLAASLRLLHVKAQVNRFNGYVEGDFHGSLDTLYADQLKVVYRHQQIVTGSVRVDNPLNMDSLYAHIDCQDFFTNEALLSSLLADFQKHPMEVPRVVSRLGDIHYRGKVDGRLKDLKLHGAFKTRLGTVTTDASLIDLRRVDGKVSTRDFRLRHLLLRSEFGRVSATMNVRATLPNDSTPLDAALHGVISQLDILNYTYSDICLNGSAQGKHYTAKMQIDDPNLAVLLDGEADLNEPLPYMDATMCVDRMNLANLHVTDSAGEHAVALRTRMHFQADAPREAFIDRLTGKIVADSIYVSGQGTQVHIPEFTLSVTSDETQHHIKLFSSAVTAGIDGAFNWATLPATVRGFAHQVLPSFVSEAPTHQSPNDLDFYAYLLQTDELVDVLTPNRLNFLTTQTLKGYIHESDSAYEVQMVAPSITRGNTAYDNLTFYMSNLNADREMEAHLSVAQHILSHDSTRLRVDSVSAKVDLWAGNDSLIAIMDIKTPTDADTLADLIVHSVFSRYNDLPLMEMHVMPSTFAVGINSWQIGDAMIRYCAADTSVQVDHMDLATDNQSLHVHGIMSTHPTDSLYVEMKDVDLHKLLSVTSIDRAIDIRGLISGWVSLYGAFSDPSVTASVRMPHGVINGTDLGCVSAHAGLDEAGNILIDGSAVKDSTQIATVKGLVTASKPTYWELYIDANGAPLSFINMWTNGILDDLQGDGYGRIHVFGRKLHTWVTARAYAKNAALTVPFTGCRYFFSDSVILDTTSISFPKIQIRDSEGHRGVVSGLLTHNNFKDFKYHIAVDCNNLKAIDLSEDNQRLYYGRAYATGKVDISGEEAQTRISVNAKTVGNSDFYLNMATSSSASSTEYITFRQPDSETETEEAGEKEKEMAKANSHILLNFAFEVDPQTRAHLVLNPHNGDGIVGRGEGNLRLNMDASTGALQLLGTYSLLEGTFSYTLGNLVHRDFTIAEGSTVTWSGNAAKPLLNITAKYRCTASLTDLFGADTKNITSRSSIPVDVCAYITGPMDNLASRFGIEFPQSDESVAAQINAVINTEAMLMRQVIYLLMFNRFYAPENMSSAGSGVGTTEVYSLLSSAVTGQINTWLSKLTSMVNVGFNMRAEGQGATQSYETQANIQIQPIPRLTINGNVGYRYNDMSNRPIFGDADIEYELTADGKLRAKVYTHSVDKYSLRQSSMQEGVGFVFRHDFNPGDAKRRREQRRNSVLETSK